MKAPHLIASIQLDDKEIASEIEIPMRKSVKYPGRYDLIASLQQLPSLKKYKFSTIGAQSYEYNLFTHKKGGYLYNFPKFDNTGVENLLSLGEIEHRNDIHYSNPYKDHISTRMTYILYLDGPTVAGGANKTFKCAMCPKAALIADTKLNLAFCSYECLEK